MQIKEIVKRIKSYCRGIDGLSPSGKPIDDSKTRDVILFGDADRECTGIVTTCYTSIKVIRKAHELGANLIICHESLFWNHGDHTDWLSEQENRTYFRKKKLLEDYGITVWRCHDYIHSGIPDGKGGWQDGIFKGFIHEAGFDRNCIPRLYAPLQYSTPVIMNFDNLTVKEIAETIIKRTKLNGIRLIGSPDTKVRKAALLMHIMFNDNDKITLINKENIDLIIAMEIVDYTVNTYMRDSIELGDNKAILCVGHFNTEEPGMKYMLNWINDALQTDTVKTYFVQSGDASTYLLS